MTHMDYEVHYPDYFDGYEYAIVAKGYFADIVVSTTRAVYRPVFFDMARFQQEVADSIASPAGYHVESNVVLVEKVDRAHIDEALSAMAVNGFAELSPSESDPRQSP
jgi:hypothetical protein